MLILIIALAGCGYTTRSLITNKYKTIYITPFKNMVDITKETYSRNQYRTYRPSLETEVTRSVSNRFLFDGNLRPVAEESADLMLKGELREFRKDPLRYDSSDNVTEYRITLVVNIALWDRKENQLLWEENGFTGTTTYFTSGSLAKTDDAAISAALIDLSRRVVERAVEDW
jgi:hypothetical protein